MTCKSAVTKSFMIAGTLATALSLAACEGSTPVGEGSRTLGPPGWQLEIGDTVSALGRVRLSREFRTVVAAWRLEEEPIRLLNSNQAEYGVADFELVYVEADQLVRGEDRNLYACVPSPEPSPNGVISIDQEEEEEHWKTPDGANKFSFQPGVMCDPDKRYRAMYVYLGQVR